MRILVYSDSCADLCLEKRAKHSSINGVTQFGWWCRCMKNMTQILPIETCIIKVS